MFQKFYPDAYVESTYKINFKKLYQKGYRGILFDIDNTLVPHGADADEQAEQFFRELQQIGFSCCLMSNNKLARVKRFNQKIQVKYIENAHKPSTKSYIKAMDMLGTSRENTLFVGDQLFTDIYGAKRTGLFSILVKPIHPKEEIQIVLKRYLEKVVLHEYNRSRDKAPYKKIGNC